MSSAAAGVVEHAADEAGGEVIYSTDEPSPVKVKPPPIKKKTTSDETGDDVVDASGKAPSEAFEMFSGKVYRVPVKTTVAAAAGTTETPLERLTRLNQELIELEQDLSTTKTVEGSSDEDEAPYLQLAGQLKSRMEALSSLVANPQHEELTRMIQKQRQVVDEAPKPSAKKQNQQQGVIYELFGGRTQFTQASTKSAMSMEERLLRLEQLVGTTTTSTEENSFMKRLQEMESLVKRFDEKSLEDASRKAKVIRSDLEAASKARNKLSNKKDDSKTIMALHNQMMELQGLSSHLPALVDRLQQLALLHAQSATFTARLAQSENQVGQIQATVAHLETLLENIAKGMNENMQLVEKNVQRLDERLLEV